MASLELDKCKKYLRSIFLAYKGGIPAEQVFEKYYDMVGDNIPYRQYNYNSLETFLQSIPDVCRITFRGRNVMVEGVATPETSHIERFVNKEKGGAKLSKGPKPKAVDVNKYYNSNNRSNGYSSSINYNGNTRNGFGNNPRNQQVSQLRPAQPLRTSSNVSKMVTRSSMTPATINHQVTRSPPPNPIKISPKRVNGPPPPPVVSTISFPVTKEQKKIWSGRVKKLLEGRTHGLYKSQLEKFHEKQWSERLPVNWAQLMANDGLIKINNDGVNPIIFPVQNSLPQSNASVVIPGGSYPKISNWTVTITHVEFTSSIWVRFGDAGNQLDDIEAVMGVRHSLNGKGYDGGALPAGNYFNAKIVDSVKYPNSKFVRVKVLKVDRLAFTCQCFLLDYGTKIMIPWNDLMPLDKDFLSIPVMAMKLHLLGIEESKDPALVKHVESKLLNRRLMAIEVEKGADNIPKVMLFDGDEVVTDNLSSQLKKLHNDIKTSLQVTINNNNFKSAGSSVEDLFSLPTQTLPQAGDYYDLKVSHIVSPKEIYIQNYTTLPSYQALTHDMGVFYSRVTQQLLSQDVHEGMIVAVRHGLTWLRGKIVKQFPSLTNSGHWYEEFLVNLVDTGEIVISNLHSMQKLDVAFVMLAPQATKMELSGVNAFEETASVWLKHKYLGKSLVGLVDSVSDEKLSVTLYDTTISELDIVINDELMQLGLTRQ